MGFTNQGTMLSGCLLFASERSCLKLGQGSAPVVMVPRPRAETVCLSSAESPTGLPCRWTVYLSSQPWEVNQRGVWVRLLCQKMGYDTCLPWNIPLRKAGTSCPCDWKRDSSPLSDVRGLRPWGPHSPEPGSAQPGMPYGSCDVIWLHGKLSRANVGERPHCLALKITVINFCEKACLGSQ